MKKVFDQTVRDIKREVNKKVLKVPGIEQKVLDATSNEPWGPHGVLLADIAQATRNYHEYQMIMSVLWKRINDTGKNWRHVYKALTVLEYLVGHGSERVIDEIRERAYQLSTLSDFRYIDSSGRDQGNNVRKKSQNLVVLVNDKDRIIEVRQKAAANRDKFRNFSAGGMYRPGYGDRYDDERYEGRYGNRDEDRNGYGREREHGYRDDDQYGRYGDPYNRDGDRYGRDYGERYSRDGYRDDDYRGRSRSLDGYGPRSRSADIDRDRGFDDDGPSSSRGSGARADDQSLDGSITRRLERKFSEQNIGAPPNHEEAVGDSRSPAHGEGNGDTSAPFAPGASSSSLPPRASSPPAPKAASPQMNVNPSQAIAGTGISSSPGGQVSEVADEFDPRGPVSAVHVTTTAPTVSVPTTSNNVEVDLLGSLSDSFGPSPLAIMPVTSATTSEADVQKKLSGLTFDTTQTNVMSQPFEDPFGDSPFKAIPSMDNVPAQHQISASPPFLAPTMNQNAEVPHLAASNPDTANDFGGAFSATASSASDAQPPSTSSQFLPQEQSTSQQEIDILADILPPSVPPSFTASHAGFSASTSQPAQPTAGVYGNFNAQGGSLAPVASNLGPQAPLFSGGNFLPQGVSTAPMSSIMTTQTPSGTSAQFNNGNLFPQQGSTAPVMSHVAQHPATGPAPHLSKGSAFQLQGSAVPVAHQTPTVPTVQQSNDIFGNVYSQGTNNPIIAQSALSSSTGALTTVPQPTKDKFETKSTVWTDTLSRGLVNLNISGPKINPLADIGIDFDAINRKEKRMEKPTPSAVTSTITMGKAMGSGSGIGRAGAGGLRPPPNPMIGSGMGMGMGGGPGTGMHMGGYRGISQPMGMGMGTNMGMNMGMGSNMGMGQGGQMQPPGSTMPGGYNPMMGMGGYMPQQPYGGGYR